MLSTSRSLFRSFAASSVRVLVIFVTTISGFSVMSHSQSIHVADVRTYGAQCDGTTDDSAALQAALSASIAHNQIMTLPSGVCYFTTGLLATKGPHIRGEGEMGIGASILRYGGRATALTVADHAKWIYAPVFENFGIQSTGNASIGIRCDTCSEGRIDNLAIGAIPSSHFDVALDLSNSNGIFIEHLIIAYNSTAVLLVNASAIDIQRGDFYALSNSALTLCGKAIWDGLRDNWIETTDYAINIDDSLCSTPTTVESLRVTGNAFLFNGGTTVYKHQMALHIVNSITTRRFVADQVLFTQNHVLLAGGLTNTSYPIDIVLGQNPKSYANVIVRDSFFAGALSGIAPCSQAGIHVVLDNNTSLSRSGAPLTHECAATSLGR